MIAFARVCDLIAATAGTRDKVALLATYLAALPADDLTAAARFLTGNPFAARDARTLAVGGRLLVRAAQAAWGVDDAAISAAYRDHGDLGAALGGFVRRSQDLGLFRESLTPGRLAARLNEIAAATGKNAQRRRGVLCERILGACGDPREATYIVKIMAGELRIGLREALVLEAIAVAFEAPVDAVRAALAASGDIGAVALAAKTGTLERIELQFGVPIAFMLASPIAHGSPYRELAEGSWLVEDKYDGVRAQAHKRGDAVMLFSRTFSELSNSFPEITAAVHRCRGDFIIDGEIVAERDGHILPFRFLQPRLGRKDPDEQLRREIPIRFVAFDAIAAGGRFLLGEPLVDRRAILAQLIAVSPGLSVAPEHMLADAAAPIDQLFEEARARGNEGLVFKRSSAPYVPGRRGKWWLKLKRELSTLDCVVVGVEWGHGKRKDVLSDYTFAVRAGAQTTELLTIGKAYSGLTDAEIAELTPWFLDHRIGMLDGHVLAVEPKIVIEVAFDVIQKSALHTSGFALRFPRIARLRTDKPVPEIDAIDDVQAIYAAMLEREGIA